MHNKSLLLSGLFAFVFLASCNSNKKDDSKTTNQTKSELTSTTAQQSSNSSSPRAAINVTLTGGDMAGTYTANCNDACCSWGIAGENVFGNQYSETGKGPKELSSVQLIVDDVKQGNKTTNEFTVTVSFGELFSENGKSFNINTRKGKKEGSGTLTIQYEGEKATVKIKGTSKEGPAIDLTMACNRVTTVNNLGQ